MESRTLFSAFLVASALLSAALTGCSSAPVARTGRSGLFNHLADGSTGNRARATEADEARVERLSEVELTSIRNQAQYWAWPVSHVKVTSHFGKRGDDRHEGIDLKAPVGTPVYAVEKGVVAYAASRISGYGKMVVIRHQNGLSTVYAHNSKFLVRGGQKIKKGQRIAMSGQTGRSRGPHVHFEVRRGVVALDPIAVLPNRNRILGVRTTPAETAGVSEKEIVRRPATSRIVAKRDRSKRAGSQTRGGHVAKSSAVRRGRIGKSKQPARKHLAIRD